MHQEKSRQRMGNSNPVTGAYVPVQWRSIVWTVNVGARKPKVGQQKRR